MLAFEEHYILLPFELLFYSLYIVDRISPFLSCTEIQNFREIAKNTLLDEGDSQYEEAEGISSLKVETNFAELIQKIEHLKCKLEEALGDVKAKESKILELEAILDMTERPRKKTEYHNLSFLEEKCKEMEIQLEDMLEKKIEAEIEYIITKKTTQNWKVLAEDHVALLEEQKYLSGDQSELFLKVKNSENKAIMLNEQAEKLEKDLLRTKEVFSLQSRVYKYTLCCFVQVVILFIAFGFFLVHLLPSSSELTPT